MDVTMIREGASLRKFETECRSRRDGPTIEDATITRHCMRHGRVILPYDGGANTDSYCLWTECKTAVVDNSDLHCGWRLKWPTCAKTQTVLSS